MQISSFKFQKNNKFRVSNHNFKMELKDKKRFEELFAKTTERSEQLDELFRSLHDELTDYSKVPFSFNDIIFQLGRRPEVILRDAFQLFGDAVKHYVKKIPLRNTSKSSRLNRYDMNGLFVDGCETPFFADILFGNRFMDMAETMRKGVQTNRIYLFEGPPGSGKSTFLNNLLNKFQEYTHLPEGVMLKTVWHLDLDKIGRQKSDFWDRVETLAKKHKNAELLELISNKRDTILTDKFIDISCPHNDHPILQIPKEYRRNFLDTIIKDETFKNKLFKDQQYSWVFKEESCHICSSIYDSLYDILKSPVEILEMLNAKIINYSRKFGHGISIYNPGDEICKSVIENGNMQNTLHKIFNNDKIKYIFSPMAYTNNGVYAIMDMKENNIRRFKNLHSIISDGVNKVNVREEKIRTLFIGLINPEDKIHFSNIKSFQDRIINVKIPYILDYESIIKVQKQKFGNISKKFMPEVLESFAKVIISTRLEKKAETLKTLITDTKNYPFLDIDLMLLKMEIFSGKIPQWLSDKDKNAISHKTLNKLSSEAKNDGFTGISGRKSLSLFNKFYSKFNKTKSHITIVDVINFFEKKLSKEEKLKIPDKFLESLHKYYDYIVLQQVKECIYFYNRDQITKDILNYLYAINFDIGIKVISPYTKDKFVVNGDFFKNFEAIYLGTVSTLNQRLKFRKKQQKDYVTNTLSQEMNVQGKDISKTNQFKYLFVEYTTNLKQNALAPYINNANFRRALLDFGKKNFEKYDARLKSDIKRLIINLKKRFGYNKSTAIQVVLYVLDNKKI